MAIRCRVDQLRDNTHLRSGLLHTAFQHIAYAELLPKLLHVHRFALVGESRVTGDNEETGDLGEVTSQHVGKAIAKVVLVWVFTHVDKRQHYDQGFVGQWQRWRLCLWRM